MTRQEMRCCAAELLGTFALVFFGCGSIALVGKNGGVAGHLGVNVVFGATVAAMIYTLGHISCAHFNPAVTLGFVVARRFPVRLALPYIASQTMGAFAACCLLALLLPAHAAALMRFGATVSVVNTAQTIAIEAILTFFLMFVIIAVATDRRAAPTMAGAAIGITVMLCGIVGGPISGCSMNPARSLAPALFAGGSALSSLWLYCVGPCLGAMLGAVAYEQLRAPHTRLSHAPISCCASDECTVG